MYLNTKNPHKLTLWLVIVFSINFVCVRSDQLADVQGVFLSYLINTIGNGTSISSDNVLQYFEKHSIKWSESRNSCLQVSNLTEDVMIDYKCLQRSCLSPDEVYTLAGLDHDNLTHTELSTLATVLLHLHDNSSCSDTVTMATEPQHHDHVPPSSAEVWGIGILSTTLINFCSLGGVIALPFIHGPAYQKMLLYMVGLAVGTLTGSSVLFLIPEALELTDQQLDEHSYVWKCLTVIMGMYVFFIIERVLKMITESRDARKLKKNKRKDNAYNFSSFHDSRPNSKYKDTTELPHVGVCGDVENSSNSSLSEDLSSDREGEINENMTSSFKTDDVSNTTANGPLVTKHSHHGDHVAPVAWMIIFGDGIHNFIDGVSIGAAFTESILAGISISIAILCEELPHELGDFAVLLNAGMKIKKAILYNFLSACMCYLGLVVGIFLGENTSTHTWVFAFAGGMFLYISLVDMMPEMNSAAESKDNQKTIGRHTVFLLQNLGLLTGFTIMVIMAIYGGSLEEAVRSL